MALQSLLLSPQRTAMTVHPQQHTRVMRLNGVGPAGTGAAGAEVARVPVDFPRFAQPRQEPQGSVVSARRGSDVA